VYPGAYLNADNRFVRLLLDNEQLIFKRDRKLVVEAFFKGLRRAAKRSFEEVTINQNEILKWFVQAGVIDEKYVCKFTLTKEDFGPAFL
jgi:hypothetical protein